MKPQLHTYPRTAHPFFVSCRPVPEPAGSKQLRDLFQELIQQHNRPGLMRPVPPQHRDRGEWISIRLRLCLPGTKCPHAMLGAKLVLIRGTECILYTASCEGAFSHVLWLTLPCRIMRRSASSTSLGGAALRVRRAPKTRTVRAVWMCRGPRVAGELAIPGCRVKLRRQSMVARSCLLLRRFGFYPQVC